MTQFVARNYVTYNMNVKNITFLFSVLQPKINWRFRTKEVEVHTVRSASLFSVTALHKCLHFHKHKYFIFHNFTSCFILLFQAEFILVELPYNLGNGQITRKLLILDIYIRKTQYER